MCGICGKVYGDPARPVEPERLAAMNQCLRHRGPDDEGIHLEANAGLGHRRLSIIDIATGSQPIGNEDGSCWIVFNGEIYNHHELRAELESRGHRFKTHSDTEAILHLYEEEGERCAERLRGMFAFAIWDARRQQLLLARDRVGKKPLYYLAAEGMIAFASEMKSLLVEPEARRDVDLEALWDYLTLQYVPPPATIFKSIRKVPPAHTLTWRQGELTLRRYWRLDYEPKLEIGEGEAIERIRAELDEAVRVRLESEVPLGCLLSGGVDSSAVVAMMRRHVSGPLRTFSIGFEEKTHDELQYARIVAEKFSTIHEEFVVRPDAIETLPLIAWHADEPFGDSSALPTWHVSAITRRQVTGALNGDGGDESFAGYPRYRGVALINRYARLPTALRRHLMGPAAGALADLFPRAAVFEKLESLNRMTLLDPAHAYAEYLTIIREAQKRKLAGEFLRPLADRDSTWPILEAWHRPGIRADLDRKLASDVESYLSGDLLVKMDRMAMAHGLETRSPLLDHRLMELAARLPAGLKMKDGQLKYLLKKAMEPELPKEILYRPRQGFGVPLGAWFRGPLAEVLRETLLGDRARARGFFNVEYVGKLIEDHNARRQNHEHRLWMLLVFETWCRTFLDRPDPWTGPIRL